MKKLYSIAIYPPDDIMHLVKKLKELLSDYISWFPSKNSKAHITIIQFHADEKELYIIKSFLTDFCSKKSPFNICLENFKNYLNGAFFIALDKETKFTTRGFMKQLQKNFPMKSFFKSSDPHMSIARQLDQQDIRIANHLFQNLNAEFECDSIVLRVLNENKGQFDVLEVYYLKGDEGYSDEYGQLTFGF